MEARGVGCGLGAELSEVEIGAGTVAEVHGFVEAALGVEAVEDDAVDGDGDDFDDDFDEGADQGPVLQAADQRVVDVLVEERFAFAVYAAPAPHVFCVAVFAGLVENGGADGPHDDAEDEETNGEDGVVDGGFFGSSVAAAEVGEDDAEGHGEGDAGDAEEGYLGPCFLTLCPGWEFASWGNGFCGVEYGEGGGEHGEDDETAAEVDTAEGHFCHSDSSFDFLYQC